MQVLSCEGKSLYGSSGLMAEIRLVRDVAAEVLNHTRSNPEQECCGLLAGRDSVVTHVLKAHNAAENPEIAYEIAPRELFQLMRKVREAGLELLGIYHSHPNGDNEPSARDVERAYYPDAAYFILSARTDARNAIRAFSIREGRWMELQIQIV